MNRAVFLDRDGTISTDSIINSDKDMKLLPGVAGALSDLQNLGYLLIIITNQGGLSIGHITRPALSNINDYLYRLLVEKNVFIDMILSSGWHDKGLKNKDYSFFWRKPCSGMIYYAQSFFDIDLNLSFMIGDRESDISSGNNVGCRTFLIDSSAKNKKENSKADFIVRNFRESAEIIISQD